MLDSFSRPTSPAYLRPTSPAYSNSELPDSEPYIPTSPEYHPTESEPETYLDSDRSAETQRASDQDANDTDRASNQETNEVSSESATFSTPVDQPIVPRTNVAQIIHRRRSSARRGFPRLPATLESPPVIARRRLERVNTTYRINHTRLYSLEHCEVITDPRDIQKLYLLLLCDPRGSSIRRTLHVECVTGRDNNSDQLLLLSFQTPYGLAHKIFAGHNREYAPSDEAYIRKLEMRALRDICARVSPPPETPSVRLSVFYRNPH